MKTLSFVSCPNEDHLNKEGGESQQLYYFGNEKFKCNSCNKEFTIYEIEEQIKKEYAYKLMDLHKEYQQSIAELYRRKQHNIDNLHEIIDFKL